jgi:hypothetical protein
MIKSLLILVLLLALLAALFLTRPHQADFEQFARTNKLTDAKPAGGPSIINTINQQLHTFAAQSGIEDPTETFLKHCSYDNYFIFINVRKDGQVIYTGMVGHWFKRAAADGTVKTQASARLQP